MNGLHVLAVPLPVPCTRGSDGLSIQLHRFLLLSVALLLLLLRCLLFLNAYSLSLKLVPVVRVAGSTLPLRPSRICCLCSRQFPDIISSVFVQAPDD